MKTALKILGHVWFCFSIAICILGGDIWAEMFGASGYVSVMTVVHA